MAGEFQLPVRVYIEDTDAGGIVYYVNYLKYMERARTEYLRSLGFGKEFIFSGDLMFVVRAVRLDYRAPARIDDELLATAQPQQLGAARLTFRQSVRAGERTLVEGQIEIACVGRQNLKPQRIPAVMREALERDLAERGEITA